MALSSAQLAAGADDTGGLFRRIDPRVRLVAAALFAVVVVALRDLDLLAVAVTLAILAAIAARLPPWPTLHRAAAMDAFIIAMLLMLPFTVAGETILTVGPLTASWEGTLQAIEIALKANAIVLLLLAVVGTMSTPALGQALSRMGFPPTLVHLLFFTARYVDVLGREYQRMRLAMRARAFHPRTDAHTWRSLGFLLGMLLVRSLDRSERVLAAMKCRGFDGRLHAGEAAALRLVDLVAAAVATGLLMTLVWLQYA